MFKKYQHVEKFGSTETNGIEFGECFIFPKLDGTNASVWMEGKMFKAGSRNRELTLEADNLGFYNWFLDQMNLRAFLFKYPELRLYGEWLKPHSLKTYNDDAWNKFYVFDVMNGEEYLHYNEYAKLLEEFNIPYVPAICTITNPLKEQLINALEGNTFLIKDGQGLGEGIVIKNYSFKNKFGNVVWAKIVRNEFKDLHSRVMRPPAIPGALDVERKIVDKFVTQTLVDKEYAKILNEGDWSNKKIPQLLGVLFYTLIKEEGWEIVRTMKYPTIDYKRLQSLVNIKIKELLPNIF